jgi:hypothetical protein
MINTFVRFAKPDSCLACSPPISIAGWQGVLEGSKLRHRPAQKSLTEKPSG